MGDAAEILGLPEVRAKWGVERPEQVIDIIGLWGDVSDNIPGVPGIGEKTAGKLINQYGSVEKLLARTAELKGKLRQNLEEHRDRALLSKRLATINCEVPIDVDSEKLKLHPPDEAKLKQLLVEFEFNSIGRRLFGDDFKAGRGLETPPTATASRVPTTEASSEEAGPAAESRAVEHSQSARRPRPGFGRQIVLRARIADRRCRLQASPLDWPGLRVRSARRLVRADAASRGSSNCDSERVSFGV